MDNKTLSDLIGLIYDVASDASLWPRLLQMLADELAPHLIETPDEDRFSGSSTPQDASADTAFTDGQAQDMLIELLHHHITRALELNRRLFEARKEMSQMQDLLERLPLGLLMVDGKSHVVTCNARLQTMLSTGKEIYVKDGVLCASGLNNTKRLREAVRLAAENETRTGETLRLSSPDASTALSVLILPFKYDGAGQQKEKNKVIVLVATPGMNIPVSPETLMSLYQLTRAEAKLVGALVNDRDVNAIAGDFGISKNTARNQLKSIYEKTGTHRQAELVRQIITGPAMLATLVRPDKPFVYPTMMPGTGIHVTKSKKRERQTLQLPDGRQLGFAEYGLPAGRPVMYMHAFNGSRLERHPDESIIEKCGIRLIIPDRPGVGLSDHRKDLTLLNWADDVAQLADHLRLKKFNLIGYSLGAPFTLACACRLQERIGRVTIVCGVTPFTSAWELEGMYLPLRLMFTLCRNANPLLEPLVRFFGIQVPPEKYFKDLWQHLPPVDRALICDPAIQNRMLESARENLRRGDDYILQEVVLASRDWGFKLDGIETPVDIWHGEQDRLVPPDLARRMAGKLRHGQTRFLPGSGHYLVFHCWKEILLSSISGNIRKKKQIYSPYGSCFSA